MKIASLVFPLLVIFTAAFPSSAASMGGAEFLGKFEDVLVPAVEDFERVVFANVLPTQLKGIGEFGPDAHYASSRLFDPRAKKSSLLALLVEKEDETPVIYVDLNGDDKLLEDEKLTLAQSKEDNPFLWKTTVLLPIKNGSFKSCPIFLQYYKGITMEKMTREDRMVTQSTEVFARGKVDVNGKPVLVQYAYTIGDKKVSPSEGWLGVDVNDDGDIDMDNLSYEAGKAGEGESVIFRIGSTYVSTKKADLEKNQIVLREHSEKEYKRIELDLNKEFPDFAFSDFDGKKRKLSEFRGKYVLLDIWGFWCPPCRKELPYIRESYRRFQDRDLVIVGVNTDEELTTESMKKALEQNGMKWTQAKFDSVIPFLKEGLRVNSFPTTFLISPEGKILSMSRNERGEPDLRGQDLLETLDGILPK